MPNPRQICGDFITTNRQSLSTEYFVDYLLQAYYARAMTDLDTKREKIIDAARERFGHYGYPKTTIAELASDCAMSSGNIYRFFQGKLDIATEIARRESLAAVDRIEYLLSCPTRSARERLETMMFIDLRTTYHLLENKPKVVELAQIVMNERPMFQVESIRRERRAIGRVIKKGAETGEFNPLNAARTSACLHNATVKYRYAQVFTNQSLEDLERELADLLTILLRGLLAADQLASFEPTKIPPEGAD